MNEKPEYDSQVIIAVRKAVRPINISDSFKSLYRFEGSQGIEKPQTQMRKPSNADGRLLKPIRRGRNGGSKWVRAKARRILKTAQEKKLISAKKSERHSRKIPVRSDELEDRTQIKQSTVTSQ